MTEERDVGLQFAVVKPVFDPITQRREVEEKISAVEEWNNLLVENEARMDIRSSMRPNPQRVFKEMPNSGSQLSFWFENGPFLNAKSCRSKRVQSHFETAVPAEYNS